MGGPRQSHSLGVRQRERRKRDVHVEIDLPKKADDRSDLTECDGGNGEKGQASRGRRQQQGSCAREVTSVPVTATQLGRRPRMLDLGAASEQEVRRRDFRGKQSASRC
eukprot:543864-Hanusia_phi.AAC.1